MLEKVSHERAGQDQGWLFTSPPLVHLTTADLGNLADGKYDFAAIASRLDRLDAVVVFTPQHLVEWIPLAEDSRERRFKLADRLSRVVYINRDSRTLWLHDGSSSLQVTTANAGGLQGIFYDEQRQPQPLPSPVHMRQGQRQRQQQLPRHRESLALPRPPGVGRRQLL